MAAALALAMVGCHKGSKERTELDLVDEVTAVTKKSLSSWDPKPLGDKFAEGPGREEAKADDAKAMLEAKSKFGALKSLGTGELKARDGSDTSMETIAKPLVRYSKAEFEKGPATVEVWIRVKRDTLEWRVDHYKIVPAGS